MQIVWKGQACFNVTTTQGNKEQVRILIDPFDNSLGLRLSPQEADIVLVTHDHDDHNNVKVVKGDPFLIDSPGEYEAKGIFVQGIPSFHDDVQGKERGLNTIYTVTTEGITLCHMGDIGQKELTPEQVDQIGDVHVLMIPVGGIYTITGKEARKIISQIEPVMVIPMHYALPKMKAKLAKIDEFLEAMGKKSVQAQPKLTLKERDVAGEKGEAEVMVLES